MKNLEYNVIKCPQETGFTRKKISPVKRYVDESRMVQDMFNGLNLEYRDAKVQNSSWVSAFNHKQSHFAFPVHASYGFNC